MSVYNGMPYLSEAVESVLEQTFGNFEFIIINDGSTDGSTEVLRQYAGIDDRIRLLEQENRGLTPSLNRGINRARGAYVARMDADDVCLPRRFELQVDYLDRHPGCVVVGGEPEMIDAEGKPLEKSDPLYDAFDLDNMDYRYDHKEVDRRLLTGGWFLNHPTVMMRRSALEAVGGYDEHFKTAQDRDLFLRLAEVGKVVNLPKQVLKYRCHASQVSRRSTTQNYWTKRARRAAYRRRDLPLPKELRLPAMLQTAIGKELRKTRLWPVLLNAYLKVFR
jgi:glycosyltransferase involved in cell wall biosynthesis